MSGAGVYLSGREGVRAGRYDSDLIKDIVECEGVKIPCANCIGVLQALWSCRGLGG